MRIVGLTGSIACGKSTVASHLRSVRGVAVVDLDRIAHDVQAWGSTRAALVASFGPGVVKAGQVDREALGGIVFVSRDKRRVLNGIMGWRIALALAMELASVLLRRGPLGVVVVLDAPLLFETGLDKICFGGTVAVHLPPEVQLARLRARDGIDRDAARARVNAQMPSEAKARRATMRLDNTGTEDDLREAVQQKLLPWLQAPASGRGLLCVAAAGAALLLPACWCLRAAGSLPLAASLACAVLCLVLLLGGLSRQRQSQ